MKRVLLMTNQLFRWSGSETVLVELAEELSQAGVAVSIFANVLDTNFMRDVIGNRVSVISDPSKVRLEDFDIIYCQHQVLTVFLDQLLELENAQKTPRIVYGHLSPFNRLEFPGPSIEKHFADYSICNSAETLSKMIDLGLDQGKLQLFPNPAPSSFFNISAPIGTPKKLLAVSNHFPTEIKKALKKIERAGVQVTRRGRQFTSSRVTAEELQSHDMVLTIGKTVQYALAAQRPVYVYDRFGGPGWLSETNFRAAEENNFSGRCVNTKKSPDAISKEIINGRHLAVEALGDLQRFREKFRLEKYVQELFLSKDSSKYKMDDFDDIPQSKRDAFKDEYNSYIRFIRKNNRGMKFSLRSLLPF